MGFPRQDYWSGLPFRSPLLERVSSLRSLLERVSSLRSLLERVSSLLDKLRCPCRHTSVLRELPRMCTSSETLPFMQIHVISVQPDVAIFRLHERL